MSEAQSAAHIPGDLVSESVAQMVAEEELFAARRAATYRHLVQRMPGADALELATAMQASYPTLWPTRGRAMLDIKFQRANTLPPPPVN